MYVIARKTIICSLKFSGLLRSEKVNWEEFCKFEAAGCDLVKFVYSEKDKIFCKISTVDLIGTT